MPIGTFCSKRKKNIVLSQCTERLQRSFLVHICSEKTEMKPPLHRRAKQKLLGGLEALRS
jgi:hypothetical protein